MNDIVIRKEDNTPIKVLLKLSPVIFYFLICIIDVGAQDPLKSIILGILSGFLMLLIEGWGLIAFEVFLFVSPKGKTKIGFGTGVIVASIVAALWQYMLSSFLFNNFDGYWRPELIIILAMNAGYALVTLVIMLKPDKTENSVQNTNDDI